MTYSQGRVKFPTGGNQIMGSPRALFILKRSADLVKIQSRRLKSGWKRIECLVIYIRLDSVLIDEIHKTSLYFFCPDLCSHSKGGFTTMNQNLLAKFGNSITRVENALNALRHGQGVIVTDDEDRENEGDLIFAAESLTESQMAILIRECSGIVCLCLPDDKVDQLGLPMMVENNTSSYQTAFTISIEAARGVTTGVSAADRVTTIKAAIADDAVPEDLHHPGHVFPLRARPGGVLERRGHTESVVDMMRMAGLRPYGVLCELTNPDGTMARMGEIVSFALNNNMPWLRWRIWLIIGQKKRFLLILNELISFYFFNIQSL